MLILLYTHKRTARSLRDQYWSACYPFPVSFFRNTARIVSLFRGRLATAAVFRPSSLFFRLCFLAAFPAYTPSGVIKVSLFRQCRSVLSTGTLFRHHFKPFSVPFQIKKSSRSPARHFAAPASAASSLFPCFFSGSAPGPPHVTLRLPSLTRPHLSARKLSVVGARNSSVSCVRQLSRAHLMLTLPPSVALCRTMPCRSRRTLPQSAALSRSL